MIKIHICAFVFSPVIICTVFNMGHWYGLGSVDPQKFAIGAL